MKKNVKRILPILLGIFILVSIFWYLFVYDRDFTKDMLLQTARYFEGQGDHTVAALLYDLAYGHSDGEDSVAIELAEHYRELGNYTQAEVTLSRAISEGASADLYVALCQTFVEQNKLLDAVTMLDNIADPAIRQEIALLRPAAPTATPEQTYHNQYITVELTSDGGSLYVTTNGEYPSLSDGPSDGLLPVDSGETIILALTVGDNGLVSPLATFNYTVIDVIREVTFTDAAIDAAVREALDLTADAVIYSSDLWTLTELTLPQGADSYQELSELSHLESLTIENSLADSLDGLNALTSLRSLTVRNTNLRTADLLTVAALPALTELTLTACGLSGIDNLSGATQLTYLDLSNNSIRNFSALSFMSGLQYLDLSDNALTNLNSVSALSSLTTLKVSGNSLTSVSPVAGCTQLQVLDIHNNAVISLAGLEELKALEELDASYNALTDISVLSGLTALRVLDLSNNALTDITCLSVLNALETFSFSYNQIAVLPQWRSDCALVTLDGAHNQISSLDSLADYENLNYVLMEDNLITGVGALVTCPNLIKVNVYNNPITDVSDLTNPDGLEEGQTTSIIVIWNPLGQ